jgi:DHA1 family inner membrane transport protein
MSQPSTITRAAHDTTQPGAAISILILAIAAFVIVTTEYLIVGLLPALSRDLAISISAAGQLVTLFAFTVMLFGPPLTAWLSHLDRKKLFVAILVVFALSNALAALAPNIWVLALARFIPALALPVFWGTASETAGQLAGTAKAGQAVSRVYLGISAALLFGIPLGTVAANSVGWRNAFWMLAVLSLLMAAALWALMPAVARTPRMNFKEQARLFREPYFLANVALSIVVFTAMFTAYTYLADILERLAGIAPARVGWWLMGFGAIGLVGNWLGGKAVDRAPVKATAAFAALLGIGMALSVPAVHCLHRPVPGLPGARDALGDAFAGAGRHHQRLGRECRHRHRCHAGRRRDPDAGTGQDRLYLRRDRIAGGADGAGRCRARPQAPVTAQAASRSTFDVGTAASITIYCGWGRACAPRQGRYRISAATSPQAAAAAIQ